MLRTLWDRLADANYLDAIDETPAEPPTPAEHARQFVERLRSAVKPRLSPLGLGDELEITGRGLAGTALLYDGRICRLTAFSNG